MGMKSVPSAAPNYSPATRGPTQKQSFAEALKAPLMKLAISLNLPIEEDYYQSTMDSRFRVKWPFEKIEIYQNPQRQTYVVHGLVNGAPFQLEDPIDAFPSQQLRNKLTVLRD